MPDIKDNNYKPFLPADSDYLKKVTGTIQGRDPIEEIDFNLLNEALSALGINDDPYELLSMDNLQVESVSKIIDKSFEAISGGVADEVKEKLYKLWDYLGGEDSLEKSDLIFVFGGPGLNRVTEAVRLYKEGYGKKILFTGQKAAYMKDIEISEAEYYANEALKLGMHKEDMILETEAKNTPENAVNSVKILKSQGELPSSIILITLPYHMRRSYLTFKAVADWNPKLIRHVAASAKYTREDYFKDKNGWSYVFNEFVKIYAARLMRHF